MEQSRGSSLARGRSAGGVRGFRPVLARPFFHRATQQPFLVDIQPGMQLTPTPQHILFKPAFHAVQALVDLCHKHGWGEPQFHLHSASSSTSDSVSSDSTDTQGQLYLYKVTLPDLPAPYNTITPNKLSYSIDEAKEYAAEYVLGQLGIRLEMPSDLPQLATPVYMAAPTGGLGPAYPAFGTLLPPGSFPPHRQRPPPGASPSSSSPKSLSPHPLHVFARPQHYSPGYYEPAY